MKKRVLTFFGLLLVFAFLLVTVVLFQGGSPTGLMISQDKQSHLPSDGSQEDFALDIKGYKKVGESIYVSYTLSDQIQKEQEIVVSYSVYDTEENLVSEGKETVNLEKGATNGFTLQAPLINENNAAFRLKLSAWNGRVVNEQEKDLSSPAQSGITGDVIGTSFMNLLPNLLVTAIFGLFLFVSFRFVNNHKKRTMSDELKPEFDKRTSRRFIKIN